MTIFIIQYDLFFNNKKGENTNNNNSKSGLKKVRNKKQVISKPKYIIKSKTNPSENSSKR